MTASLVMMKATI